MQAVEGGVLSFWRLALMHPISEVAWFKCSKLFLGRMILWSTNPVFYEICLTCICHKYFSCLCIPESWKLTDPFSGQQFQLVHVYGTEHHNFFPSFCGPWLLTYSDRKMLLNCVLSQLIHTKIHGEIKDSIITLPLLFFLQLLQLAD